MYNQELMGQDRGGVSRSQGGGGRLTLMGGWESRLPLLAGAVNLHQKVITQSKHRCETAPDPLGPQTGAQELSSFLSIWDKHVFSPWFSRGCGNQERVEML